MKLVPIAKNQNEVIFGEGTVVLFSYQTPVAAMLPSGRYVRTDAWYSSTTSRHINKWLAGVSAIEEVSQDFIDNLCVCGGES